MWEPSRSFVEANGSLHNNRHPGDMWEMMVLILASSSASLPPAIERSSSRLKCVKTRRRTPALNDVAATNMPHCIMSWAMPTLRKNVVLPPRLAPVTRTSALLSALKSLPTVRPPVRRLRPGS